MYSKLIVGGLRLVKCSLYLSSKLVEKFEGNDVVGIWFIEGVEGSERFSGGEKDVF